jgi:hypothetical protein
MHKAFRRALRTEERRVVRNWTWGVLIVYGTLALAVFGIVGLTHHSDPGSKDRAAAAVAATADKNHRSH